MKEEKRNRQKNIFTKTHIDENYTKILNIRKLTFRNRDIK